MANIMFSKNRLPATTSGWNAVLDPTSNAYQTAYKFSGNGLLDYGMYDEEFARKIGSEENTKLRNRIIAEHNAKFPIEYYSQQGDYDIIDLSSYMMDTDPTNPEIIYYKVSQNINMGFGQIGMKFLKSTRLEIQI